MCNKWDPCTIPPILERTLTLAQIGTPGAGGLSADVPFRVTNPTTKLKLTLEAYVQPGLQGRGGGTGPTTHDYTDETWQLYATTVVPQAGDIILNPVFYNASFPPVGTARPMPDSYEIASGVKVVNGTVHVVPGDANQVGENYMVKARWEPIEACMSTEERDYWFSFCQLTGPPVPEVVSGGE